MTATPRRSARRLFTPWRAALAAAAAAALVAACGGGTSAFEAYVPEQYVAFGDEASVVMPDGRRYTVNPLTAAGAIDCKTEPIWTQALAAHYGFTFRECNPAAATEFKAVMRATAGAKVDDLKAQIDAHVAAGGFPAKAVVTVMVGVNDVLELYARFPATPEADLIAEAQARGTRLGEQVNRLVDLGARVIVATVVDVGLSPYGSAQKTANTDTDRAALLSRLVAALNGRLRVTMLNDGRFIGLVLADEVAQSMVKFPSSFGLSDATTAACTVALPACTSQTLVDKATSASWLWADATSMSYGGHARLGQLAIARAAGNPF